MKLGAVIIGRNEGARLKYCLESVASCFDNFVYVDSGSTDGSVSIARALGAKVVVLADGPFTAARGRNTGFQQLCDDGGVDFVQFIDGDCELRPDWVAAAKLFLESHPDCAIVFGRRRERFPENSVYNRLCDWEWNVPPGEVAACGGDAMVRTSALSEVGAYNATLIAGEEPEMCLRLRRAGWRVFCIDQEMTIHDANILRARQHFKRSSRTGYTYAEGFAMHGGYPDFFYRRELLRVIFWALIFPIFILTSGIFSAWALILLLIYPVKVLHTAVNLRGDKDKIKRAVFLMIEKFAQLGGVFLFVLNNVKGRSAGLIEYK